MKEQTNKIGETKKLPQGNKRPKIEQPISEQEVLAVEAFLLSEVLEILHGR